ncbi:MAG: hypothetical protein U9P00_14930 [Pseudomonadota bacterium]|nr:hypothetical protein [Pseudomonadota bacterium]
MESELKVDTYRLAVLPIAYLGEQQDPFDCCRAEGAIDESYRDVFSTGVWLYALYNYILLVRDKLGDSTADAVWAHQQVILSGGVPEAGEGVGRVFDLIRDASSIGPLHAAIDSGVAEVPLELNIALTLLLNLPESPGYARRATDRAEQIAYLQPDIDRRFASCLSRCRDEIVKIFFSTFSMTGSVLH